jgi:hypothetical protein
LDVEEYDRPFRPVAGPDEEGIRKALIDGWTVGEYRVTVKKAANPFLNETLVYDPVQRAGLQLPIRERVVGPEHPDTLATRHDLAWSTGEAGDAAAARDQFAALLPIGEPVLGPEHPATLATRRSLAFWTKKADGDAERGVTQLPLVLAVARPRRSCGDTMPLR